MGAFEDTLWDDLVAQHGHRLTRPSRDRHVARWATLAAAVVVGVAAVIFGPSMFGGSPPAAYAVVRHPDGSVTLTIKELKAVDKANAELRRLGVRAVVLRQPTDETVLCSIGPTTDAADEPSLNDGRHNALALPDANKPNVLVIYPKAIPPDAMLRLMYEQHRWGWGLRAGLVRDKPGPNSCWWQVSIGTPGVDATR